MKTTRPLESEPLWYLKGLAHSAYLQTDHWRIRRSAFLETLSEPRHCNFCGIDRIDATWVTDSAYVDQYGKECSSRKKYARLLTSRRLELRTPAWHVHHLTYERIGEELDTDLELLCAPCHNLKHFPHSAAAHHWAALRGVAFKEPIPQHRPDTLTRGFTPVNHLPEIELAEELHGFVDVDLYPDPIAPEHEDI